MQQQQNPNRRPKNLFGMVLYLVRLYSEQRPWLLAVVVVAVAALSLGTAWALSGSCGASGGCPSAVSSPCSGGR
ncbi:MAG: hypothetical protein CMH57_01040 [Myxococcales bacterium]|nr:hypothetical protein [Myxococcales bacterium]